jgi:ribonuclease HI
LNLEADDIRAGLVLAKDMGYQKITVESDSLNVINAFSSLVNAGTALIFGFSVTFT